MLYQQGDVLIESVEAIPPNALPRARRNGRHILAEGEATGHAHAVADHAHVEHVGPDVAIAVGVYGLGLAGRSVAEAHLVDGDLLAGIGQGVVAGAARPAHLGKTRAGGLGTHIHHRAQLRRTGRALNGPER